jgi:hypothetical protein
MISDLLTMSYIKLNLFAQADPSCVKEFLFIPSWFKYLKVDSANQCAPELRGINDIWLIGLAVVEMLTRFAVLVAIGYIVYAGIKYSNSRANAEKVNSAKFTLQDALTGLIIAIAATAAVSFIAERLTQG